MKQSEKLICSECGEILTDEWLECDNCEAVVCQTQRSMSCSCFHKHLINVHEIDWTICRSEEE